MGRAVHLLAALLHGTEFRLLLLSTVSPFQNGEYLLRLDMVLGYRRPLFSSLCFAAYSGGRQSFSYFFRRFRWNGTVLKKITAN